MRNLIFSLSFQRFSFLYGFFIWLPGTLLFRFAGSSFFLVTNGLVMVAFYLGIVPILYFLTIMIFKQYQLNSEQRVRSALLMALPGMMLDVFCVKFHTLVFPDFSIQQVVVLGSWLLWVYAIVLITGILKR